MNTDENGHPRKTKLKPKDNRHFEMNTNIVGLCEEFIIHLQVQKNKLYHYPNQLIGSSYLSVSKAFPCAHSFPTALARCTKSFIFHQGPLISV